MNRKAQKVNKFFDKQRDRVAEKQAEITAQAMDTMFENSPHYMDPESPYSMSEYDANHKIFINGEGEAEHYGATMDKTASRELIDQEKEKLADLKCGDSVTITNSTPWADDVEYGNLNPGSSWNKSGFAVFQKTRDQLEEENGNVIKSG